MDELKAQAASLGASLLAFVQAAEAHLGAQPRLRHFLHAAQAEAEQLLGMSSGSISPDAGVKPPNP
jgi:hypothetical protein